MTMLQRKLKDESMIELGAAFRIDTDKIELNLFNI